MPTAHRTVSKLLALAALAAMAGCHQDRQHGETFDDQEHPTTIGLVAQAQAAAGAKQDATLYDCHFRQDRLDALGQGKLNLMLKGTVAGDPVDVYLDMPADMANARKAAVVAYLMHAGVPAENVELAVGPNPHCTTPTAYNLASVYKTDGNANSGQATDLNTTPGGGGGGGATLGGGSK